MIRFLPALVAAFTILSPAFAMADPIAATTPPDSDPSTASIAGDWKGSISYQNVTLPLVFHFSQNTDGTLAGKLDSPDQGALGIALGTVTDVSGKVKALAPSVSGEFDGVVSSDGSEIVGQWSQGTPLTLILVRSSDTPQAPVPAALTGSWIGKLTASTTTLHLTMHFVLETSGAFVGTFGSPDEGATGIPFGEISMDAGQIRMPVARIGAVYEARLSRDYKTLAGTWTQGGASYPLTMSKATAATLDYSRPQEPKPPFPYITKQVSFPSLDPDVILSGTLSFPSAGTNLPAVVLISGSGPNNRDENVFGHKIFLVLADYLTRHGIAVLRYDKRGVGESTGDYRTANIFTFAEDAQGAFDFLSAQKRISPHAIGLIGHSEGGDVAPIVAIHDKAVKFVVLLGGPAVPGDRLSEYQNEALQRGAGVSQARIEQTQRILEQMYAVVRTEPDDKLAEAKITAIAQSTLSGAESDSEKEAIQQQSAEMVSPWIRSFVGYDPRDNLSRLTVPVLALYGSHDQQVPPSLNAALMSQYLQQAGNKDYKVKILPNLNHLFQTSPTGSFFEYNTISETFAPSALAVIANWILAHQ